MSSARMRLGGIVAAGVLGVGLTACGGDDTPAEETTDPAPTSAAPAEDATTEDAQTQTEDAGQTQQPTDEAGADGEEVDVQEFLAMLQEPGEERLSSYTLAMTMLMEGQELSADGAVDLGGEAPAMAMVLQVPQMGMLELIIAEGQVYMAMPGLTQEGQYVVAPPELVADMNINEMDVSAQWDEWETYAERVVLVGSEDVDGTEMTRYEVTVDAAAAMQDAGADDAAVTSVGDTVVYDVWLDEENLMRQMVFELDGQTTTIMMDNWGEPQDIQAPDPSLVSDLGDTGAGPTG
jgi:hypothetical protein